MRVLGLSRFKMRRMVPHPEACTSLTDWNLCTLSFEFYQTPTLRSSVIGNRCVGVWVWERRGQYGTIQRGNICFRATWGRCLYFWPCISKVALHSFPWTTHCPWHQQEDVMIKYSPIASRKRAALFPRITLAFTNTLDAQIAIQRHTS